MRRGTRIASVSTAVALTLSLQLPALAEERTAIPTETTDAVPDRTEAPDLASARLAAVLGGKRVEALSERTEASSTWVNPNGTVTTETASGPVRIREGGEWKQLDTTLVDTGTRLEPEAAVADVKLSDGGAEDFAAVTRSGRTFGLDWSATKALPAPEVEGDTAVYPEVVPDGDLHVTALPQGFTESLILRERPTEPVELRLPVTLEGLSLEKERSGHLRLEDATGKLVASAPAPRMWGTGTDPKSGDPTHSMEIETRIEQSAGRPVLVLKPSMAFLTDPDVTYPVNIDPTTTLAASTDTWVATNYPDSQRGSTELKAGTYDGGTTKARSYVKFDVSKYAGKQILDTEFRLHSYWSSSCSATGSGVAVRRITANWDPSAVTWGAQPATTADDAVVSKAAYGYSSACPANFMRWDVDGIVQAWADGQPNYGLQVRAVDEADSMSWRRFRSANYVDGAQGPTEPTLVVTYNTKPNAGSAVSPAEGTVTADTTPTLTAQATDPDADSVRLTFEVWNKDATAKVTSGTSAFVASGKPAAWTSGALAPGTYKWRVSVYDGKLWNGGWSAWRTLTVDTSVPVAPSVTSSVYPADGLWHGGAGTPGSFTVADPQGKAVAAEYSLDGGPAGTVALSAGRGTVTLTPSADGTHVLSVRVKNAAGTWSDPAEHAFRVGRITGVLSPSFVNEVAETHFSDLLHPEEEQTEPEDRPVDTEYPEIDDTPVDYQEQEDPEVVETEESVLASGVVELPGTAGQEIVGTSADGSVQTSVAMPSGAAAAATLSETGVVVYPNTQTDADTLAIRTGQNAVETFHLLRSASAATSYTYTLRLLPGQTATQGADNVIIVSDELGNLTFITAPVARDAKGAGIPVKLTLSGNEVTASLAPAAGQTLAYPVLMDPGFGYGSATPSERSYCFWNPIDCTTAYDAANKAFKQAQDWYPDRTLFQGTGDSFRHCYWNARMEIRLSTKDAYEFATRHESTSKGVDKQMDLKNNAIGREIGRKRTGQTSAGIRARDDCRSAQRNGKLWIIKSGRLVRSNS
ncbi:DNRLRE domain-containing protein [Streptomyces sp. NPDC001744]|uniref:DNRLRE domain-containing protein n=1 Tax=Streptomyces sp. NPDC001744 TaxID=3364606 RepID=UPI0036873C57